MTTTTATRKRAGTELQTSEEAGHRLRGDYGVGLMPIPTEQLLEIARDSGADVDLHEPLGGRVREVYAEGTIAIRRGMPEVWTRWLLAHGLGHHMLHPHANHLYLAGNDRLFERDRHEYQAELFAGALLVGEPHRPATTPKDALEMSAWYDVPFACVLRWLRLRAASEPKRAIPTLGRLVQGSSSPVARLAAVASLSLMSRTHDMDANGVAEFVAGACRIATRLV
jgi:hypothetical protein